MKDFKEEFQKYISKLKNHEPFAFSRWADGELWILENKSYSLSPTSHGYTNPEDQKNFNAELHKFHHDKLWNAFRYKADNYHIGITTNSDAGIVGYSPRDWMIDNGGSNIENITFANLFINSNYQDFRMEALPIMEEYETIIMCNERAKLDDFDNIIQDFRVGSNCIINDDDKIDAIVNYTKETKPEGKLFLFCASSLGNICIHKLHEIAPNNTYLDLGSALNPDLYLGIDRGYLSAWAGVKQRGMWDMSEYLERNEEW
jgi:hypothetical protein|tara:strand:+ start:165 stop:941 length:777 start_codon:yes stop_codon:yes gene_type:complete